MRYEGPALKSTDRAVGLSVIGELPASDEKDLLLLGGGIIDKCRTGGREPTTPACRCDEGLETGWNCDCGARGAGMERVVVRRGAGPPVR